jgi:hypothetical protein
MGKSDKFLVIVERQNEPLLDALSTAYEAPKYEVVADRRVEQRRGSGRPGTANERRRRLADVSPFAIVASRRDDE